MLITMRRSAGTGWKPQPASCTSWAYGASATITTSWSAHCIRAPRLANGATSPRVPGASISTRMSGAAGRRRQHGSPVGDRPYLIGHARPHLAREVVPYSRQGNEPGALDGGRGVPARGRAQQRVSLAVQHEGGYPELDQ